MREEANCVAIAANQVTEEEARAVKAGDVLAVALSPQTLHYATVQAIETPPQSSIVTIQALLQWDDGDEFLGNKIILHGPQATKFKVVSEPTNLILRLGKSQLSALFRGKDGCPIVHRTNLFLCKVFALTLGSQYHMKAAAAQCGGEALTLPNGSSFTRALADFKECALFSLNMVDDPTARKLPRMFDLVGKKHTSSGNLVELSLCFGNVQLVSSGSIEQTDLAMLGTPLAIVAEGRGGKKNVELVPIISLGSQQRRYPDGNLRDPGHGSTQFT